MAKNTYGLISLNKQFPNDAACLEFIFSARHDATCSCGGEYQPLFRGVDRDGKINGRKQYQCSKCRHQIAPLAGTIFAKSETPLRVWFYALMSFSNAKSGLSASKLARDCDLYYKTAFRMLKLIRKSLPQNGDDVLYGDVEMDVGYFGGRGIAGKDNKNLSKVMKGKSVMFAAVQRGGKTKIEVKPDATARSHKNFLWQNVSTNSRLMTDAANRYDNVASPYKREYVNHSKKEYVRGNVHINSVEALFSHIKRSIKGTHKSVSPKLLSTYLDAFVWLRDNRHSDIARFAALLDAVSRPKAA